MTGTAPKDTPIGHLVFSAYDYIINEALGFPVDYSKSLGQKYEEMNKIEQNNLPILCQSQFDSAVEKCENSIREMHRPIVKSKTAKKAKIVYHSPKGERPFDHLLDHDTYEHMQHTIEDDEVLKITCRVSSYNINTYKGRIYVIEEKRPVPFILHESIRSEGTIDRITRSLRMNARESFIDQANIECTGMKYRSSTGRLKGYRIISVS